MMRRALVFVCVSIAWFSLTGAVHAAAPITGVFSVDGTRLRSFPLIPAGSSAATGDLTGDTIPEIVTGTPPGVRAQVMVYALDGTVLSRFSPFSDKMKAGINVTIADVAGDGRPQIAVVPRRGGGSRVLLYSMEGRQLSPGFFAYSKTFGGGANLTSADIDGDGRDEIVAGVGPGGAPHLAALTSNGARIKNIFPYELKFRNGLSVASFDVDRNGREEIIVAPQERALADVKTVDPSTGEVRASFRAFGAFTGGVSVVGMHSDAGTRIAVAAGRNGGPDVKQYDPVSGLEVSRHFYVFDGSWRGGVTLASLDIDGNGTQELMAIAGAPTLSANELAAYSKRYVEPAIAGASYSVEHVAAATGFFTVRAVRIDLNAPGISVKTVTSTAGDCADDCPVHPLQYLIDQAGGFAGINGSYFCPAGQGGCVNKDGTYFWLWYNSVTGTFVNLIQNQFNTDPVIAFGGANAPYYYPISKDFHTKEEFEALNGVPLRALLSNGPLLVQDGIYAVQPDKIDAGQKSTKTTRVGIGLSGRTLVMFVASRATVRDLAYIAVAMGLDLAINLDGGSSTALSFNNTYKVGPGRNIPNAVVISAQ